MAQSTDLSTIELVRRDLKEYPQSEREHFRALIYKLLERIRRIRNVAIKAAISFIDTNRN